MFRINPGYTFWALALGIGMTLGVDGKGNLVVWQGRQLAIARVVPAFGLTRLILSNL